MTTIQNNSGLVSEGETNVEAEIVGIGSNFHIHYKNADSLSPDFFFREVLEFVDAKFKPEISNETFEKLRSNRVIVVSNRDRSIDIFDYSNELIRSLQSILDYKVFEIVENQDDKSILSYLMKVENGGIYLLNEIDVSHVDYDLAKLMSIATQKDLYLIITTNYTKARWQLGGSQLEELWIELNEELLYSESSFRGHLIEELSEFQFVKVPDQPNQAIYVSDSLTINSLLKVIDRPVKFSYFLRLYQQFTELPSDEELKKVLNLIKGRTEEVIKGWFNRLSHSEKLIAIAFAVIDGVLVSQFFEIMSRMASNQSLWKVSAPELEAIDLKDIAFLEPFLHGDFTIYEGAIVASSASFRTVIFESLWSTHRRHLTAMFPMLISIVTESYQINTSNWELFGTTNRRTKLRKSFVGTISDFGSFNLDAAESILLDLAASGHFHVQNLVASTLVRWRGTANDDQFFMLLDRWQNDGVIIDLVKEKLDRRGDAISATRNQRMTAVNRIKCTVAITVSRAALYDKKNKLDERLIHLYGAISGDTSEGVQFTIEKSLPQFIRKHINQLKNLLFENLMKTARFKMAISQGLIDAMRDDPKETKLILKDWIDLCLNLHSKENQREKPTYRDNIIITILAVLTDLVEDDELRKTHTSEELLSLIEIILKSEGRAAVRKEGVKLLASVIACYNINRVDKLKLVFSVLRKTDKDFLVGFLASTYVLQRAEQSGGDAQWEIDPEKSIPVWFNRSERPLTQLETQMFKWIGVSNSKANEVAIFFFLEVAKRVEEPELVFLKEERKRIEQLELARRSNENATNMTPPVSNSAEISLSLGLKIKIFFMLLFEKKENKRTLKDLLRLLINLKGYKILHIRIMNAKWIKYDANGLAGKLGKWLDRLL